MQKAEIVLSLLSKKSREDGGYVFKRLYRNMFNHDLYRIACNNVFSREGCIPVTDKIFKEKDFMEDMIENVIKKMKSEKYFQDTVQHSFFYNTDNEIRRAEMVSFMDLLVQETIRMQLEAIFGYGVKEISCDFRKTEGRIAALYSIKNGYRGGDWIIIGNMEGNPRSIKSEALMKVLRKRIEDGRFLRLIKMYHSRNCGYEGETREAITNPGFHNILGPVLKEIYLGEVDDFAKSIKKRFSWTGSDVIDYIRCGDEILIFVNGRRNLAEMIRKEVGELLEEKLKMPDSKKNLQISCLRDGKVIFLGYHIGLKGAERMNPKKRKQEACRFTPEKDRGTKFKTDKKALVLTVPGEIITNQLRAFMKRGKSTPCKDRLSLPVPEIINRYNEEMESLYNYYCLASDVSLKLGRFKFYHYNSLLKTIAKKEKISVRRVLIKYGVKTKYKDGKAVKRVAVVPYISEGCTKTIVYFNRPLTCKKSPPPSFLEMKQKYIAWKQPASRIH